MLLPNFDKKIKYYLIALIIIITGAYFLNNVVTSNINLENQKIEAQLDKTHNDAIINAKAGIQVYATIVSSLKSFTNNSEEFPSEKLLQKYLNDILKEIKFNDSILINYIDKDHYFRYIITPKQIDPQNLKGINVSSFRSKERIEELERILLSEDIRIFSPVNLREGWTGFPFNFSAKNKNNEVIGYFAPIINVKYLLDFFYENNKYENFAHKFVINDTLDLTREAFYNGSEIFNSKKDEEYYKNFDIKDSDFIYSTIELFGLKLKIGSAFKNKPVVEKSIYNLAYISYALVSVLLFVALHQYLRNRYLNKSLKTANKDLESNLLKIQTLIKEIHHRIKNNMQMVSGILLMQEGEYEDENIKKALRDSQSRIQSMSLVHEKLYGNSTLKEVKTKEYIEQLINFVEDTVKNKSTEIIKFIKIDKDLSFDADTTSNLGLIINELITNSFKYAFDDTKENSLSIEITKDSEHYKLLYKDSGSGLPDDFDIETSESLGMQLISILTEQLGGTITYEKEPESTFVIYFNPLEKSFHG
ncbi:sensor histidine kinase [Olleya aquimaris]|uniref:histidine kinase n=1 Tax=Olleya aquimaris TaxID=639310 RepID=A0A327RGW5_9FLAO|nr:sensor histidine kinase [Olleya aquimaris]RAJ16256.1 two-component sensor histidine kinase [Olleya aquimaris]